MVLSTMTCPLLKQWARRGAAGALWWPAALGRCKKNLALAATAVMLGGCAAVPVDMASMASSHNRTLDQIDRDGMLMNLLRASDEQPLLFTTVSYVGGNGSLSGGISGNDFRSRAMASVLSMGSSGNLSVSSGFSYNLSTLDNEQFTRSFLADVPMDRLYYLSEGTYLDNTVLWTLVADSATVQPREGGASDPYRNTPDDRKQWTEFQSLLANAMALGLSMEEYSDAQAIGPVLSRDEATYQIGTVINGWNPPMYGTPLAGTARPVLTEVGRVDGKPQYQLTMVATKVRFCFNPSAIESWPYDGAMLCTVKGARAAWERMRARQGANAPVVQPVPLSWQSIGIRSPREVFYYVGALVRAQVHGGGTQEWVVGDPKAPLGTARKPLIRVVCGAAATESDPLAQVTHRGRTCQIPRGDDTHSTHVMQYLSLLVALSKVPGAVSTAPSVVVR